MTLTSCHDDKTRALLPGVVRLKRSSLGLAVAIAREPLSALPAECRTARMVLADNFGRLRAYVCDPELIHEALVRNAGAMEKSAEMKQVLGTALGEGLLTSDGAVWRHQRQAIAPAFQHERLTALLPAMIGAAEATRDRWRRLSDGAVVDLGHEMMRTTFRIILDTMLSGPDAIEAGKVERGVTDFLGATSWMFALALLKAPRWLPFPGKVRAASANLMMRRQVLDMIAARRRAPQCEDLVGMLLAAVDPETGQAMTDTEIADNLLTFIAAGHETTAVALGWTFALLDAHRDCRARLRAEIESVTGGAQLAPAHVAQLVYARQVVSEAMRLYPPAPIISRRVTRDLTLGGVALPAGSTVFVPIQAVQRHESLWAEPETFDPDRFSPEAARTRHRFAYMPFGAGPRICVGMGFALMEAVAILAVLAQSFDLERTGPMPAASMRVTLRPAEPLRMRVRRLG